MPTWCSVSSCGNRSDKTSDVSYHKFPKNEEEKKIWILFCGKGSEWVPAATARMCSVHFRKLDIERNLRSELIGGVSRRFLKSGAIPSILNESERESLELNENKKNKGKIEIIIADDTDEEEESTFRVTQMLEDMREEEQVPSTSIGNQGSVIITQTPEEPNLDYKTLYSILLEENDDLRTKNSKLSNEIRQSRRKLRVLKNRLYSYQIELLECRMRKKLKKK